MTDWSGRRVLILGAARQGIPLARWLTRHRARVTLSDARPMDELASARAALADVDVEWAAGGHPLQLLDDTDVLCPSGGVPLNLPIIEEAQRRGIPLSNDTQIFLEVAPCRTIGITGSAGKTTTTALVGEMAKLNRGPRTEDNASDLRPPSSVFIGGNIGDPLIKYVDDMKADDLAILEISSFQLDQMNLSPNIAAILNVTPNHLDRHGTMQAYTNAKARILDFQTGEDIAVLSRDDDGSWNLRERVKGRLLAFSLRELDAGLDGVCLQHSTLNLRDHNLRTSLLQRDEIPLRGEHNVSNVLAALTIGHAAGFDSDSMRAAVRQFRGVPHRLELVRELHGVRWYDDSIATAPERTMAAIHAFDEPVVLMLGGRDKNLPWDELAQLAQRRAKRVVLFGEAAELIQNALARAGAVDIRRVNTLKQAVAEAAYLASAGDIVLLAPGGTSFDEFKDFAERGAAFQRWVQELS